MLQRRKSTNHVNFEGIAAGGTTTVRTASPRNYYWYYYTSGGCAAVTKCFYAYWIPGRLIQNVICGALRLRESHNHSRVNQPCSTTDPTTSERSSLRCSPDFFLFGIPSSEERTATQKINKKCSHALFERWPRTARVAQATHIIAILPSRKHVRRPTGEFSERNADYQNIEA